MAKLLIPLQGYTQKMAETSTDHLSRSPPPVRALRLRGG